jgi:hypothetical protein
MTPRASAASPIGFVSAAGTVRVPQDLISWYDFLYFNYINDQVVFVHRTVFVIKI